MCVCVCVCVFVVNMYEYVSMCVCAGLIAGMTYQFELGSISSGSITYTLATTITLGACTGECMRRSCDCGWMGRVWADGQGVSGWGRV